jgi:hypothetical protein
MRLRLGLGAGFVRPVPSGVTAGSTAMIVERTLSGDTPRLAEVAHPARDTKETAAIAPVRENGGVIMPAPEAETTPTLADAATACAIVR